MKKMRKKKKTNTTRALIWVIVILLAVIAVLLVVGLKKEANTETTETAEATSTPTADPNRVYQSINHEIAYAGDIEITHTHIAWDQYRRPGEVREIKYITIHETDNRSSSSDAAAHSAFLTDTEDSNTGWHYTVDDHSIYHTIPDNEISWNAGDQRNTDGGNVNGIGIEMCVNYENDFEKTLENTAMLVATLCVNYDLTPDDVRFHSDFMDKECPHRLISEGRTDEFLQMIADDYTILLESGTEE